MGVLTHVSESSTMPRMALALLSVFACAVAEQEAEAENWSWPILLIDRVRFVKASHQLPAKPVRGLDKQVEFRAVKCNLSPKNAFLRVVVHSCFEWHSIHPRMTFFLKTKIGLFEGLHSKQLLWHSALEAPWACGLPSFLLTLKWKPGWGGEIWRGFNLQGWYRHRLPQAGWFRGLRGLHVRCPGLTFLQMTDSDLLNPFSCLVSGVLKAVVKLLLHKIDHFEGLKWKKIKSIFN